MYFKEALKNKKGNILMITLLILTSTLAITLGAAVIVNQGLLLHRTQRYSTVAYFAAESGAEKILYEDRKASFDYTRVDGSACVNGDYIQFSPIACSSAPVSTSLANGAVFSVVYNTDGESTILNSTGSYMGVKRRVELSYVNSGNCNPNCSGKECGDNGCGGSCGTCDTGYTCDNGTCTAPWDAHLLDGWCWNCPEYTYPDPAGPAHGDMKEYVDAILN